MLCPPVASAEAGIMDNALPARSLSEGGDNGKLSKKSTNQPACAEASAGRQINFYLLFRLQTSDLPFTFNS